MMFHGIRGLGQDSTDISTYTPPDISTYAGTAGNVTDTTLAPLQTVNLPGSAFINPDTGLYTDYSGSTTANGMPSPLQGSASSTMPSGSASTGFNWGILSSLFQTAGSTTASVLNAGQTTQQVQAASAAQIAAAQASAAGSSSFMVIGIAAVAAIALVMAMKK